MPVIELYPGIAAPQPQPSEQRLYAEEGVKEAMYLFTRAYEHDRGLTPMRAKRLRAMIDEVFKF